MGSDVPLLERTMEHNAWALRVLLQECRSLSQEEFHRQFEIGPGSLHDTLRHVITAMARWTDRLADRDSSARDAGTWTVQELSASLEESDAALRREIRLVVDRGGVEEIMEFRLKRGGEEDQVFHFTRGAAIVHILAHGVHHRAQVLNMLRQLGREGPDLDPISCELDGPE